MFPPYYMNALVPRPGARSKAFPALLRRAGKAACLAADEFFAAQISNPPTRRAYARPGIASRSSCCGFIRFRCQHCARRRIFCSSMCSAVHR